MNTSINKNYGSFYPYADVRFTESQWAQHQQDLAVVDMVLRGLAAETGWTFHSSRRYPSKSLRLRRWFKTSQIAVVLAPPTPPGAQYVLVTATWVRAPCYYKNLGGATLRTFSVPELTDSESFREYLRDAMRTIGTTHA